MENSQTCSKGVSSEIYHHVTIRNDLAEVKKCYDDEIRQDKVPEKFWIEQFRRTTNQPTESSVEICFGRINGPYTTVDESHPILTAFLRAYNCHEGVVLSPDDFWLMICIHFGDYLRQSSNNLSKIYVDPDRRKILTVENECRDWTFFIEQIGKEFENLIKTEIVELFSKKFSSTGPVESLLSSIVFMNLLKKNQSSNKSFHCCGIRDVFFLGNLDDWISLREKTAQLQFLASKNDDFYFYVQGVLPIFDKFIETFRGQVDRTFWQKIFNSKIEKENLSNRSDFRRTIDGWFLRLCYGNHQKESCSIDEIRLNSIFVPVNVDLEEKQTSKTSILLGGFHGVDSFEEKHKPVSSLVIIDDCKS